MTELVVWKLRESQCHEDGCRIPWLSFCILFDDAIVSDFWRGWFSKLSFYPIIWNFYPIIWKFTFSWETRWCLGSHVSSQNLLNRQRNWVTAKMWCLERAGQAKGRREEEEDEEEEGVSSLLQSHWDRARLHLEMDGSPAVCPALQETSLSLPPAALFPSLQGSSVLPHVTVWPASPQRAPQFQTRISPLSLTKFHHPQDIRLEL